MSLIRHTGVNMRGENKYWTLGVDDNGWEYYERISDKYREYKLDPIIANRIKELRLGLNGCGSHSWRALAIRVTGYEDQMTGSDLEKLAEWTLDEEFSDESN